jgi:hypothetical protein
LLIAAAMPPKEPQGMEHGGTPHQGGEKGNLSFTAQPIAAKPNNRKWGDVAVTRRPVTTGPTDDLFAREPQPSTMLSSTSSTGQDDMPVCGIGTDDQIAKVERVDARWYLVTNQGGQQRKLSDAQLLLLPMGESLTIKEKDQIEKVTRELITQLTAMGTPSLTAIGSTPVAPGQLESISSTVDAMDVEPKDGEFLLIDRSRTNTSSSAGFSIPSAGFTVDSTVCFSLASSGNTMDVDQHGDAVDQGVSDFTLLDALGRHESTPRAMEASSTVNMIDDEGLGLSVPEIEINGEQIAAARQAIERSKTQLEFADDAEIKLQRFLNPARAVTDETPNTCPCVTEEQARRALTHHEDNFTNHQAVEEVMESIMQLDRLEVFANQQMCESGDSLPDELHLAILKKKMNLTTGMWNKVEEIVEWPNGVAGIQMRANTGDYIGLARVLGAFANLAENTLKTTMGRVRYLLGLPLTRDAMRFTTHGVAGFSATRGFFSLPQSAIPFLFDVLGVPWYNANNEYTEKAIIRGAARNRNIIRTLEEKGWGPHYASPQLREGEWFFPLREIVDVMKTGRDGDIQNPVISGRESFDLCVQPWEYKRGNGGEIVQSRT